MSSLFVVSQSLIEYDEWTLPGTNYIIQVTDWDRHHSKAEIFATLKKEATQGNYQLSQVRTLRINQKNLKSVFNFNQSSNPELSYTKKQRVENQKESQALLSEINGTYLAKIDQNQLGQLLQNMKSLGLKSSVMKLNFRNEFIEQGDTLDAIPIFLSLLSILMIVMILEKISNFKKFAIMELNGWSKLRIVISQSKKDAKWFGVLIAAVLLFQIAYLVTNLTNAGSQIFLEFGFTIAALIFIIVLLMDFGSYLSLYAIELVTTIKGESPSKRFIALGYLIKIFLLLLVLLNATNLTTVFRGYQSDKKVMNLWEKRHSGYTIEFSGGVHGSEAAVGKKFHRLLIDTPSAILSRNSQRSHPSLNSIDFYNGNVMFVNDNYLKFNPVANPGTLKKSRRINEVTILIPKSRWQQKKEVLKEFEEFNKFQKDLPNVSSKNQRIRIHTQLIRDNHEVFNYTINDSIKSSLSDNPIIVVINDSLFSDDFYLSSASQGMIQFENLNQLQKSIDKRGLKYSVVGFTDAKTRVSDFNKKMKQRLISLVTVTVLSILQLIFVILFVSSTFLLEQRQKMAVYTIFGQSNLPLISKFIIFNVVGDLSISIVMGIVMRNWQFFILILPYLLIETMAILIVSLRAQSNLIKTINHGQ